VGGAHTGLVRSSSRTRECVQHNTNTVRRQRRGDVPVP
jgi:hypothetical protein